MTEIWGTNEAVQNKLNAFSQECFERYEGSRLKNTREKKGQEFLQGIGWVAENAIILSRLKD